MLGHDPLPAPPRQSEEGLVECKLCGLRRRSIGHHVARAHGIGVAEYRAQFGIRPGERLTSPETQERMAERIRRTIAEGGLDAHYAGNAARASDAARRSVDALRALRAAGIALPTAAPQTPRAVIEAIVVAIEAGTKVATAVKASPLSWSGFHGCLARHPDLKARVAARPRGLRATAPCAGTVPRVCGDGKTGSEPVAGEGKAKRTELARIVERIEQGYPRATLMYVRIVIDLLDAPDRTLAVSDLSERLGKGRDSTGVQAAIARMAELGVVAREMVPADATSGRYYEVRLLPSDPSTASSKAAISPA